MPASLTVVSDASPLRYLIAIERADLLARLFHYVIIPRGVEAELIHPSTPETTRQWIQKRPEWLEVRNLSSPPQFDLSRRLDSGEAEAIQLALDLRADFLLIDERRGRHMAAGRGLTIAGTLAIVLESYRRGYVENPQGILEQLLRAKFRISARLMRTFEEQIRTTRKI